MNVFYLTVSKKPFKILSLPVRYQICCYQSHRGLVRQQLQKHCVINLEQIIMSLMDRMKEGFSTLFGTTQRTSSTVSLTSESKHKVIIIDEADNTTSDVQLLLRASIESSPKTAGLSLPVITKTRLSIHYILGVLLLTFG